MLHIRLLGPVEVWEGSRRAPLGGVRPLAVLSALVVHLGEVLSTERLVDCVWDEQAPATASALVATHVSAVRRALARVGEAEVIRTRPPGYVADLDPGQVDARRFEELLTSGRAAVAGGRPGEAAELLAEALGLWRGQEALEGLGQSFARIEAARLAELRLVAQEESFGLHLELGRADRTIAPLLAHVAAHPLRERPRGQLMTALFRTGRVSDALRTYQEGREALREELGIDAGPELRALHKAVLTNDPALLGTDHRPGGPAPLGTGTGPPVPERDPHPDHRQRATSRTTTMAVGAAGGTALSGTPLSGAGPGGVPGDAGTRPGRPAPSHLPPDIADFVGRAEQVDWAVSLLGGVDDPGRTAPPIGVISGRSGTGKTALAVHVGHRAAELFPDGRLFVDLRAADTAPLQPAAALARLLRAMGAEPESLPSSVEELTGLYRTHTGHRRILLILDNAAGEAHVRPLLPPGPGSAVLVTSRRRLVALEGAAHLDLTVPDQEEALELLRRVAGEDRTRAEPEQTAEIVSLCGRLPLAVRIAGARLAARPHWVPGRLAARLRDERLRLNELRAGDLELRTSLQLGYADLDPQEQRALRRLALLDLPDFAAWIAAPLLDIGTEEAEEAVERLVDCHFIDVIGVDDTGRGRYRIHDLAREHARERCLSEESTEDRTAAVLRLVECWLGLAQKAAAQGPGGATRYFPEPAAVRPVDPLDPCAEEDLLTRPAAWFDAEQAGLLAAVEYCADHGMDRAARDLAGALIASSVALYNQFDAWSRSHTAAMAAVRRSGDREGEAWLLAGLGQLRYEQDQFEESYAYFRDALRLFETRDGGAQGATQALVGMATARREQACFPEALELLEDALARYGEVDDPGARAQVLYGIGCVHREQGNGPAAREALSRAMEFYHGDGDRHGEALSLRSLALCHRAEGALADAERLLRDALRAFTDLDDTFGVMYTEQSLAKVELRQGRLSEARERLGRCLEVARDRQDRFGEALVLRTLGEWHLASGDTEGAREPLERAVAAWAALRLPLWRARTLWDLAEVREADGEAEVASAARAEAMGVFRELGAREARERGDFSEG
ncbi:BTAD domain-containing putative transcriptional regulator [Streptomyces sp. SID13726]|uniref:AfsR/SARP family transcriptional regulator n=1 Tax=Streptomyces sp. SID13726 TaxID=2706058 RepID=UPI0013B9A135|nr:BTAD domain-containing putative transcriptional regulator [Streptomyces sp. SID13726]NEA97820.1 tetratricopeptide repeat protein [Streptomyces sp. SID13726]